MVEFIKCFCAFARFSKCLSDDSTAENIGTRVPVPLTAAAAYFHMMSQKARVTSKRFPGFRDQYRSKRGGGDLLSFRHFAFSAESARLLIMPAPKLAFSHIRKVRTIP